MRFEKVGEGGGRPNDRGRGSLSRRKGTGAACGWKWLEKKENG